MIPVTVPPDRDVRLTLPDSHLRQQLEIAVRELGHKRVLQSQLARTAPTTDERLVATARALTYADALDTLTAAMLLEHT